METFDEIFNLDSSDLLNEIYLILAERYPACAEKQSGGITLVFDNGKKFKITVAEV